MRLFQKQFSAPRDSPGSSINMRQFTRDVLCIHESTQQAFLRLCDVKYKNPRRPLITSFHHVRETHSGLPDLWPSIYKMSRLKCVHDEMHGC